MSNEATLFGGTTDPFAGTGTAPARGVETMDLGEFIPQTEDPIDIDKRLTRWLVFVGDVITPKQKRERADLKIGGEYLGQQYRTLIRSKGLIRRCQLTPMEIGYDYLSSEMLGDNASNLVIAGVVQDSGKDGRPLSATPIFPGDEIKGILHREHNASSGVKGFIEPEVLRGVEYADVVKAGYQKFIFEDWDKIVTGFATIPNKIAALRDLFDERYRATTSDTLRAVIEAYQESADRYSQWGIDYLKMSAQLVKVPMNAGFAHTYSEQAEMLFEQLDMTREDAIRAVSNLPAPNTGEISNADVKDLMHQMVLLQQQQAAILQGQVAPQSAAPAPAKEEPAPIVAPAPTLPEKKEEPKPVTKEAEDPTGLIALTDDGQPRCQAISTTTGNQCKSAAVEGDRCAHPAHAR